MRIVQISDTHLIHTGGTTNENFERLAAFVNRELAPDLVVNTGDMIALSPDEAEDRAVAVRLHELFEAPLLTLPGNHDVGDMGPAPWMGIGVTSARVGAYREAFGDDRWLRVVDDGWALVGLNTEILGSGLPEEDEQWRWLEGALREAGDRAILLFVHKPLWSPLADPSAAGGHAISVRHEDRERLLGLLGADRVRAVGSGHLHHFRRARRDGILEVWAPSTAFVHRAGMPDSFGLSQVGVVEYRTDGAEVDAWFRALPNLPERDFKEIHQVKALLGRIEAEASAATA